MSHPCPGPGPHYPSEDVEPDLLACAADWRKVSEPTKRAVYRTWADGDGAGTPAHNAAMRQAIREMNR